MKVDLRIDVSSAVDVAQRLQLTQKIVLQGTGDAVNAVGLALLRDSKQRAPHDIGEMIRSSGFRRSQGVGFVFFRSEYAAIVHEDPRADPKIKKITHGEDYNIRHAGDIAMGRKYWYKNKMRTFHTRRPQESWKFITAPATENIHAYTALAHTAIRNAIGRG